jgi:pimeloyl-ACP methyl ester carboxylesterase
MTPEIPDLATESYMIPSGDAGINLTCATSVPRACEPFRREDPALRSRCNLSFGNGVRSTDRWGLNDGFDCCSWLRRISHGYPWIWRFDTTSRDERTTGRECANRLDGRSGVRLRFCRRAHSPKTRRIENSLMGWSWGTAIAGKYTSEHNDKVNRPVLFARVWIFRKDAIIAPAPQAASAGVASLGAYRLYPRRLLAGRGWKACLRTEGRSNPRPASLMRGSRQHGQPTLKPASTSRRCCERLTVQSPMHSIIRQLVRRLTIPEKSRCQHSLFNDAFAKPAATQSGEQIVRSDTILSKIPNTAVRSR